MRRSDLTHAPPAIGRFHATIAKTALAQKIAGHASAGLEHVDMKHDRAAAISFGAALGA